MGSGWRTVAPLAQLLRRDLELEEALLRIDDDGVAVADRRDGPADRSFRCHVADHVTVCRA